MRQWLTDTDLIDYPATPGNVNGNGHGSKARAMQGLKRTASKARGRKAREGGYATSDPGEALEALRKQVGRVSEPLAERLAGTYRTGGRGTSYGLVLTDGTEIDLGPARQLLSMRAAKAAIFDATYIILTATQDAWETIAALIGTAAEVRDGEVTEDEVTRGWLAAFIDVTGGYAVNMADKEALHALLGTPTPDWLRDTRGRGRLYVALRPLHRYVTRAEGARLTQPELSKRLHALGFRGGKDGKVTARHGADVRGVRYWASPEGFDAAE